MTSGLCSSRLNSRVSEPTACQQTSCLVSAQSMPTNAANSACGRCGMCHLLGWARVVEGTCMLAFCDGMIGSRWRGRP